ncbi:WbqC family protein [Streptomyces sp. ISL-44]|uniref:WbqC family protein n=1 Tax=Streptomyces sp. ISL-44 TaxID=2819184 RepID=UPI001BE6B9F0|nr:WbqC family protein [Streptomyces sp. ISL-44]MBT2545306.1 WbqC family protein [Streptomyces sp. ISL-44]
MPHTNPSSATASPAASSPDLPAAGGLCAVHQPNLFPRLTTLAKLFAADTWVVLDDVQFTRRDYQHRTRLAALSDPDRTQWLSIPTHLPQGRQTTLQAALIVDPAHARRRTSAMLRQAYGASPHWAALAQALEPVEAAFSSGRTATVAETSTRILLDLLGWRGQILRSGQLPARPGRSQRLADLAAAASTGRYLCGTGGMRYLDEAPFAAQAITVVPFRPPTTNIWSSGRQVSALWALATLGPADLTDRLRAVTVAHNMGLSR